MYAFRGLKTLAVALLALMPASRQPTATIDSNGCSGTAHQDPITGVWYPTCTGNSCDGHPCSVQSGGNNGGTFNFCGCVGGGTPTCCYLAVETNGLPFGNGLCRDMGAPAGKNCPRGGACDAVAQPGGTKTAKCQKILPPPDPPPDPE